MENSQPVTEVVNIKRNQTYDVYIGRPGKGLTGYFGNPCSTGKPCYVCGEIHYDRLHTIDCFEVYARKRLEVDPVYKAAVKELQGKRLGCFCAPAPCHGDVLAVLAAELTEEEHAGR
jgi:hypothetical protein